MDRNLLLAFVLSFMVLYAWSAWEQSVRPPEPPAEIAGEVVDREAEPGGAVEPPASERFPDLPGAAPAEIPSTAQRLPADAPALALGAPSDAGRTTRVSSACFEAVLTSRGAALRSWSLTRYHDADDQPIVIVEGEDEIGDAALTPFLELDRGDLSTVEWEVVRESDEEVAYALERDGVVLRKIYRFERDTECDADRASGSYGFRLHLELANQSQAAVAPGFMIDWPARVRVEQDFHDQSVAALHEGTVEKHPIAGLGSAGFFGSLFGGKPTSRIDYRGEIDWAGVESTYFLSAMLPDDPASANARFLVRDPSKVASVEVYFDPVQVPPGRTVSREYRVYLGPKEVERLEALGSGAVASINLGWSWVTPLTRAFGWLLHAIYSVIPNYGLAIILLTILVRVVTAPLTVKQMRSMERMREVQPLMKELQEKYADDRERQSREMMELYRREKVNPLGGCFPMLLQLPVFIGLFYALQSSIHLRQAPFFGWITDLSAPESLFTLPGLGIPVRILPLVMGASMVLQQKITPMQTPDPTQARMMMTVMPVMMTVLFYQFPSGLVLYWMMSNLLAILHQLWIRRGMQASVPEKSAEKAPAPKPAKG